MVSTMISCNNWGLSQAPQKLIDGISNKKETKKNKTKSESLIVQGSRNNFLYREARQLVDLKLAKSKIYYILRAINKEECSPPVEEEEVEQILESAYSNYEEVETPKAWSIANYYDESRFKPPVPIVKGLVYKSEFHLFSATAKTGKTLAALHLAISCARGEKFLDHFETVKGTKSLVIQTEIGNSQLRERIIKICGDEFEDIKDLVFFVNKRIKVDHKDGLLMLEKLIVDLKPNLLILDPFYTLHNKNEDSSSEIAPILSDLRELVLRHNIALVLVHHQGKRNEFSGQTGHRHRGSSSFADVPDGSWSMQGLEEKNMSSLSFEMRNIEAPGPFNCELDSSSLKWSVLGSVLSSSMTISTDNIVDFLILNKDITAGELTSTLNKEYSVSTRTIQKKIGVAIQRGMINKIKEGRFTKYSANLTHEYVKASKIRSADI